MHAYAAFHIAIGDRNRFGKRSEAHVGLADAPDRQYCITSLIEASIHAYRPMRSSKRICSMRELAVPHHFKRF